MATHHLAIADTIKTLLYAAILATFTQIVFMQNSFFGEPEKTTIKAAKKSGWSVEPATPHPEWIELAKTLPPHLRLGTSSWNYPGWDDLVWNGE